MYLRRKAIINLKYSKTIIFVTTHAKMKNQMFTCEVKRVDFTSTKLSVNDEVEPISDLRVNEEEKHVYASRYFCKFHTYTTDVYEE
jgi:hypothetical protein